MSQFNPSENIETNAPPNPMLDVDPYLDAGEQPVADIEIAEQEPPSFETEPEYSDDSLGDPSIGVNAVRNVAPESNDDHPRFAMSGLLPISLFRQCGNNSWGDFNRKDAEGRTIQNFDYYPAFVLIPIFGGNFHIPYENVPTESDDITKAEAFDFDTFTKSPRKGYSEVTRTPKQCAEIFMKENRRSGGRVLDSLTGYQRHDRDRGYGAARRLVETILPYRDRQLLPETSRERGGVRFRGPFLDELLAFVKSNGLKRLEAAGYSTEFDSVSYRCYQEIVKLLTDAISAATTLVDETEAEIKNPQEIKKGYDPPNLEIPNAPVSTDLYCLAHIDRVELEMKQLRASENIGSSLADPMTKAIHAMTAIAEKMNVPPQVPANAISREEAEAMIRTAVEETRKSVLAEVTAEVTAAGKKTK
jgi:hypothetical protein